MGKKLFEFHCYNFYFKYKSILLQNKTMVYKIKRNHDHTELHFGVDGLLLIKIISLLDPLQPWDRADPSTVQ